MMTTSLLLHSATAQTTTQTVAGRRLWWENLESQWQTAFMEAVLSKYDPEAEPTDNELAQLWKTSVFRFAGPEGAYANMSIELTNLSGIRGMTQLEVLIVTHHKIRSLRELSDMVRLKSLYAYNNALENLEGLESLLLLEQLLIHSNRIADLTPLRRLCNLRDLYAYDNPLRSFEGLCRDHALKLKQFYALPNPQVLQSEVVRVKKELGIRCKAR